MGVLYLIAMAEIRANCPDCGNVVSMKSGGKIFSCNKCENVFHKNKVDYDYV